MTVTKRVKAWSSFIGKARPPCVRIDVASHKENV